MHLILSFVSSIFILQVSRIKKKNKTTTKRKWGTTTKILCFASTHVWWWLAHFWNFFPVRILCSMLTNYHIFTTDPVRICKCPVQKNLFNIVFSLFAGNSGNRHHTEGKKKARAWWLTKEKRLYLRCAYSENTSSVVTKHRVH